ncbi:amidohydrolase family protein [Nocardia sp. NPDC051030]|uniref:amidohydrolase family protein n=1 Tax=Nocardia sp. NPDC051030 TaxID=3155162 RepID=UPI00341BBC3F
MTSSTTDSTRTALTNVRVFDGRQLTSPTTVVIDGSIIGSDASGAQRVDTGGAILLPGLIDSHLHLHDSDTPDLLAAHGVTTAFDMASSPVLAASLRNLSGTTDIHSAGLPVIGPGGLHAQVLGEIAIIRGPEQAEAAVAQRITSGSDYLKLVLEAPGEGGPDEATAKAVVAEAHAHNLVVIAHAASPGAYATALDAGVDFITHVPLGIPLPQHDIDRVASEARIAIPTLTMMEGIAEATGNSPAFDAALASARALHAAGVPLLAGTDANSTPGIPFQPRFGASLHHELELLVQAGLSPVEALNAATTLPARHFALTDRGAIAPGLRADLVLLDADPTTDITATRAITRVWCAGIEHAVAN